jgi:hypothetical protein
MDVGDSRSGHDELWTWFGLSYAGWLTMPRVMMHSMPDDWQARMAQLGREWDATWVNQPDLTAIVTLKHKNKFVRAPRWLLNYRYPDLEQLQRMKDPTP